MCFLLLNSLPGEILHHGYSLLEEKVLYRTLKGSISARLRIWNNNNNVPDQEKGSIWNFLGSFIIICFVLSVLNISYY